MTLRFPTVVTRPTIVCLTILLILTLAQAHGPAEWIQRRGYKNAAGELCCGERNCFELSDGDVKVTSVGYFVVRTKETIPFSEATPSPDGRYWPTNGAARASASSCRRTQRDPRPRVPRGRVKFRVPTGVCARTRTVRSVVRA